VDREVEVLATAVKELKSILPLAVQDLVLKSLRMVQKSVE